MPVRVQRRRVKGWRMPPDTIYVGRPSMFGNYAALRAGLPRTGQASVDAFRKWVEAEASYAWKGEVVRALRGKNLACWCRAGLPCHADVLLELANQGKIS